MSGQGGQQDVARRVEELERCFRGDELSLEGVQERIAGIPPDAMRGSNFFHRACKNERVPLEMIECLLGAFPEAARSIDSDGCSPLHCACKNKSIDPGIVSLLLDRWPESANHRNNVGALPLHYLCVCSSGDKLALLTILTLLLAAAPLSATLVEGTVGYLPIHIASERGKSYPFCKRLIDANPASPRVTSRRGGLPIHKACFGGNIETIKYLLELDPEGIDARTRDGELPIHRAARSGGEHKADVIRYLLSKDPDCASKTGAGRLFPLHSACGNPNRFCLESVHLLFDAYPEAINIQDGRGRTPLDIAREKGNDAFVEFLEAQLVYTHKAEDRGAMTTPDEYGWLPLHHALRNNASFGAIKLLIAGNLSALRVAVNQLAFPLHIACEFSSVGVVKYLLGLLDIHLHTVDLRKDSTLHYACRGGNVGVVTYLLERGVPSVSAPNNAGKLPVHLLWESNRVDGDSVEYVEANWLLLLAHPETVTL